jgi:hypothetical protein
VKRTPYRMSLRLLISNLCRIRSKAPVLMRAPPEKGCSPKFGRLLCALGHRLLWSTYIPAKQEYAALVAWPTDRRAKVQDSYLPSY